MLEFFRTYQRYFFIFISVVVIASFSFFGTFSTFSSDRKKEDSIVAYAVDGSPLMLSQVQALAKFIAADREDLVGNGGMPNLCNNGVVRYDLLRTGLADLLAASYFDVLKETLAGRLERAKKFRPYVHPEASFLSAEAVWEQFLPEMKRELTRIQESTEVSLKTFSSFFRLYQQQSYLTPESLRKVLRFQNQRLGLKVDPSLEYGDLSLFGFRSMSDWFGSDFLHMVSQFILNAAVMAESKGFRVTLEEAKGDLLCNFQQSLQKLRESDPSLSLSMSQHVRSLGFDEKSAAEVWQKVLLFRRYFQVTSASSFLDHLPFKDFLSYAREDAEIIVYQWPDALRLKTLQDLVEFETYLAAVSPPREDPLGLPSSFYSPDEVSREYPELVQSSYQIKFKTLSLPKVALRVPIKELWDWQLDAANWETLRKAFSFLPVRNSREERFQTLESLSLSQRSQVDAFSRLQVLELYPQWIEEALVAVEDTEKVISISQAASSLASIEKPAQLQSLLEQAANGNKDARQALQRYLNHRTTLYSIDVLARVSHPSILTFQEAKSQGVIASIVDRRLQTAYPNIRNQYPGTFKTKEGSWKSYADAKVDLVKTVCESVLQELEALASKESMNTAPVLYRFLPATRLAYEDLCANSEQSVWIDKKEGVSEQFKLEKLKLTLQRNSQEGWMKNTAFSLTPNEWSPIHVTDHEGISFFYLENRKPCTNPILDPISFGQELIAADAQRYLAEKLLKLISKNSSIVVPIEVDK